MNQVRDILGSQVEREAAAVPATVEEQIKVNNIPYGELIGGLIFLSDATRPDSGFAANILSRFNSNPGKIHWPLAKRVFRYLSGAINYGITSYVDSDWAGDVYDGSPCSGNVVIFANGLISRIYGAFEHCPGINLFAGIIQIHEVWQVGRLCVSIVPIKARLDCAQIAMQAHRYPVSLFSRSTRKSQGYYKLHPERIKCF